jgi:flavodoxin
VQALVIYESMFGNTAAVADALGEELRIRMPVSVLEVARAPRELPDGVSLLVVGGPTHAFGMSRPNTRRDAVARGAWKHAAATGIREWLGGLEAGHGIRAACFDTRVDKRWVPGSAARGALQQLARKGFDTAPGRKSFFVGSITGPLADGELERAREWGRELGAAQPATR